MKKYNGVKTLEVLEGADNYNNWIASRIKDYIQSPALEIGAGTGNMSTFFKDIEDLTLTDIDASLVEKLQQKFKNNKNIHCEAFDIASNLKTIKFKFKSIYSVNVLEHIKDDERALKNINSLLERNGNLVLLVPAKKYAYNKLDKKLGHFRRYEKNELREKLEKASFKVVRIDYFNAVGLISWMIREKISRKSELKPYQVKFFDWIVPFLKIIEPKSSLPAGISLIAICKKK